MSKGLITSRAFSRGNSVVKEHLTTAPDGTRNLRGKKNATMTRWRKAEGSRENQENGNAAEAIKPPPPW